MLGQRTGLWRNADFMRLWLGQTISKFGSHITGVAFPLTALLLLGAGPAEMGLLTAVGAAPVLVVGLVAGVWVDRLRRRPILIAADLGRAALLLTVPSAAFLGALRMEQLYVVAALTGVLNVFFDVADQSFLPALVRREDLVEGNSKLGTSDSLAEIAGPSLGGVLVQILTAPFAILLDALSFLLSALFLSRITTAEPPPTPVAERRHLRHEMAEGIQAVIHNPVLRALAGAAATFTFFGNFIGTMYTLYLVRDLQMPPAAVGVAIGVGGIGAFLGALLTPRVTRRYGLGPVLCACQLVSGALTVPILFAGGPLPLVLAILLSTQLAGDIAWAVYFINEVSLRQALIPTRLLGRAAASMQFVVGGLGAAGALVAGLLGESLGTRPVILIGALGLMAASFWIIYSPIRRLRALPAPESAPEVAAA